MTVEYLWSQVEPAFAILCACMVTYRPLFVALASRIPKPSVFTRSSNRPRGLNEIEVGLFSHDDSDWTDMSNSPRFPVTWAVARDFTRDRRPVFAERIVNFHGQYLRLVNLSRPIRAIPSILDDVSTNNQIPQPCTYPDRVTFSRLT